MESRHKLYKSKFEEEGEVSSETLQQQRSRKPAHLKQTLTYPTANNLDL